MTAKSEQKQRSREAILASAASLLRERGIRASSVMDVMKGAGLTVGGFYGHFDSKEHLFTETLRSTGSALWKKLLETAKGTTPRERAMNVVKRYLSHQHRDTPASGCLLPSAAAEVAREGEAYRGAFAGELEEIIASLSDLLGKAPLQRKRAVGLVALVYGALSLSRATAGTPLSDELLQSAKALCEELV